MVLTPGVVFFFFFKMAGPCVLCGRILCACQLVETGGKQGQGGCLPSLREGWVLEIQKESITGAANCVDGSELYVYFLHLLPPPWNCTH